MFKLTGERSFLLPFEEKHLDDPAYLGWLRDYEVIKTINRLDYIRPVSFEEVREYCRRAMASKNDILMALHEKAGGRFVGTVQIQRINWHTRVADMGILIGEKTLWGSGIGTDALAAAGKYAFEILGLRKLMANHMAINPASGKVFEKLGFRREGVFRGVDAFEGGFHDHVYLGCFREEFLPLKKDR